MRLFLYNVFHVPMLITLIWSIRRLLIDESFKNTAFLWIPVNYINYISLSQIWILIL
jgi:hypothetical protein